MFSLLQVSFQGFLQCSMVFSSGWGLAFFAFKPRGEATDRERGGVSESEKIYTVSALISSEFYGGF